METAHAARRLAVAIRTFSFSRKMYQPRGLADKLATKQGKRNFQGTKRLQAASEIQASTPDPQSHLYSNGNIWRSSLSRFIASAAVHLGITATEHMLNPWNVLHTSAQRQIHRHEASRCLHARWSIEN
jgi:hypothetical protein